MGVTRTPRQGWVSEGLRALAEGGPEAVRIEVLAQRLGVSKGGFYGHFRNREALLTEMLQSWERQVTEDLITRVEDGGGDARARLDRLFTPVATGDETVTDPRLDLAIREWARREPQVAQLLKHTDNRRMDYLRSLFGEFCQDEEDVEVRCMLTFSVRIGNHVVAADHGDRSRAEVMELTRRWLLR